jgi:Tol biopolymer transport system component
VIFEGSLRVDAAWSPKGTRIAVVAGASGEVPTVSIIDPKGRVQDHFEAADFAWLDDDTYIAINGTSGLSGDGGFTTFTGVVGSSARQTIPGSYWQIVAGPAGAVALKLNETGGDQYVIWGQSSVSSPRDGVPVAFSPDGSLLAVVHYPRACCAGSPSPEPTEAPGPTTLDIVRTDTGESVRVTGDVNWGYGLPVDFSPDGRTVAYRIDRATGPEEVGILDIATGEVWTLPGQPDVVADSAIAWIDSSHLAVRSVFATHTAPAGLKIAVSYLPTDVAAMAVSSRGDVATARNGSPQIVIDRGGQQRTLDLPGTFDAVGLKWSPDGSTLMVACTSFVRGTPGQVVVLSP